LSVEEGSSVTSVESQMSKYNGCVSSKSCQFSIMMGLITCKCDCWWDMASDACRFWHEMYRY